MTDRSDDMANTRTRASTRKSGKDANLVGQARHAAEGAVKDLQKRLPPELVKQVERSLERGQKAVEGSLKQVQTRLNRTASQTDVDRLTRRIDDLTRQVNRLIGAARGSSASTTQTARPRPRPLRIPNHAGAPAREHLEQPQARREQVQERRQGSADQVPVSPDDPQRREHGGQCFRRPQHHCRRPEDEPRAHLQRGSPPHSSHPQVRRLHAALRGARKLEEKPPSPYGVGNRLNKVVALVDLRSDTLTMPTEGMRTAMAGAELGDDVFGEDPTVNRLQRRAAELLGKEDALFVASGTMGNLLGILSLSRSGDEIIADAESHVLLNEGAGAAALAGVQIRQVATEAGIMTADQVRGG